MKTKNLPLFESDFIMTGEYLKFEEFCKSCSKDKYIGICYGSPGVGKTLSAQFFAKQHLMQYLLWSHPADISQELRPLIYNQIAHCPTLYYVVPVANTPKHVGDFLKLQLGSNILNKYTLPADSFKLVIVDEADRLQVNSLEQVRAVYDEENIGIVLIGMPGMEKRLSRYSQLYSRIGFAHEFKSISKKDIQLVIDYFMNKHGIPLEKQDEAFEQSVSSIIRITNGNFRLVNRMFSQIKRIMEINKLQSISKDAVEAARDCLVIGNI